MFNNFINSLVKSLRMDDFYAMSDFVELMKNDEVLNSMAEEVNTRELARYPIYRYRSYYYYAQNSNKTNHIENISPLLQKIINEARDNTHVVMFPDWESRVALKSEDISSSGGYNSGLPPLGRFSTEDLDELIVYSSYRVYKKFVDFIDVSQKLKINTAEEMLFGISFNMAYGGDFYNNGSKFWDEAQLYRFYVLNSFLGQNNFKTFGKFAEKNKDDLWDDYKIIKDNTNKHSLVLFNRFSNLNSLLNVYYSKTKQEEIDELFGSLTKDEILRIVSPSSRREFPNVSENGTGYLKKLEESLKIIRDLKKFKYSDEEMMSSLAESFKKSLKNNGVDFDFNDKKSDYYKKIAYPTKLEFRDMANVDTIAEKVLVKKIVNSLGDNIEEFTPADLLAFIFTITHPKFFFNRAGKKGMKVLNDAIDKFGMGVVVPFVAEIMMEHNSELPTYSDWQKFFKDGESLEDAISPSLMVSMMLNGNRNQKRRDEREISFFRTIVKNVEKMCKEAEFDKNSENND